MLIRVKALASMTFKYFIEKLENIHAPLRYTNRHLNEKI